MLKIIDGSEALDGLVKGSKSHLISRNYHTVYTRVEGGLAVAFFRAKGGNCTVIHTVWNDTWDMGIRENGPWDTAFRTSNITREEVLSMYSECQQEKLLRIKEVPGVDNEDRHIESGFRFRSPFSYQMSMSETASAPWWQDYKNAAYGTKDGVYLINHLQHCLSMLIPWHLFSDYKKYPKEGTPFFHLWFEKLPGYKRPISPDPIQMTFHGVNVSFVGNECVAEQITAKFFDQQLVLKEPGTQYKIHNLRDDIFGWSKI